MPASSWAYIPTHWNRSAGVLCLFGYSAVVAGLAAFVLVLFFPVSIGRVREARIVNLDLLNLRLLLGFFGTALFVGGAVLAAAGHTVSAVASCSRKLAVVLLAQQRGTPPTA